MGKKIYLSFVILLNIVITNAQVKYTPHVVLDSANNVYALKTTSHLFLRLIDSTNKFQYRKPKGVQDFLHCSIIQVKQGKETAYLDKNDAEILLDYWNFEQDMRHLKKKKSHYEN